nr:hypothetical protein [Tanacetum cinerariifolium]
ISNLFRYGENQEEAVMLKTFLFSLFREAQTWLNELDEGTNISWNEFSATRMKEMLRTCYGYGLTKGTIIQIFYRGLDDPTQGILDTEGIFPYNTPNEAFKILEDKVLLKLDFSDDSDNSKPKSIVFFGGNAISSDHAILMEKFKSLAIKIDFEFLTIRKELQEMRDGRRNNQASQIYMKDEKLMCEPHEENYVQRYHGGYHDKTLKIHDVLTNHVGSKEFKSIEGVGNRVLMKKMDEMGMPKEHNKEWKLNKKVVPHNKDVYHYP